MAFNNCASSSLLYDKIIGELGCAVSNRQGKESRKVKISFHIIMLYSETLEHSNLMLSLNEGKF